MGTSNKREVAIVDKRAAKIQPSEKTETKTSEKTKKALVNRPFASQLKSLITE
jgi:hypothetical protein